MNNAEKNTTKKKSINVFKNKAKNGGKNEKAWTPKARSISEEFYNGLIEQCIINGVAITSIEKASEKSNQGK